MYKQQCVSLNINVAIFTARIYESQRIAKKLKENLNSGLQE